MRTTLMTLALAAVGVALAPAAAFSQGNTNGPSFTVDLSKQTPSGTLRRDSNVSLRLEVTNTGSASASDVRLRVGWTSGRFTSGRALSGASSSSFQRNGANLRVASIRAGQTRTVVIRLRAVRTGNYRFTASVTDSTPDASASEYNQPTTLQLRVSPPRAKHTLSVKTVGPRSANRFEFRGRVVGVSNCNRGRVIVTGITSTPSPPIRLRRSTDGDCVWGGGRDFTINFQEIAGRRTIRATFTRGSTRLRASQRITILGG